MVFLDLKSIGFIVNQKYRKEEVFESIFTDVQCKNFEFKRKWPFGRNEKDDGSEGNVSQYFIFYTFSNMLTFLAIFTLILYQEIVAILETQAHLFLRNGPYFLV